MEHDDVDEYVKLRVLPEFQPVVAMIRDLMKVCAPGAREMISYGIPAYRMKRIIAVISPTKKDITLAFSRGAQFEDKYGLLRGVGNKSKHVKLKNASSTNPDALRYYIQQAIEFDNK
ncbi:MAG: DUF1801 domain-containing protein [Bacteroidales bacterium]|nr:DUF1801 domain-containing protein [Bacteroidales bacterium]